MDLSHVEQLLSKTFSDGLLSRGEREALRQLLEERRAGAQFRDAVRARAFALARASLVDPTAARALEWLEAVVAALAPPAPPRGHLAEVLFSPGDDCRRRIAALFDGARERADACVFTITDDRIAEAIAAAHRRGVRVRIVSDDEKAFDPGSDLELLARAGIPVGVDTSPCHMHHKFAIFDGRTALTGSYNWTRAAASDNAENLLVTDDPRVSGALQGEFDRLWERYGKVL